MALEANARAQPSADNRWQSMFALHYYYWNKWIKYRGSAACSDNGSTHSDAASDRRCCPFGGFMYVHPRLHPNLHSHVHATAPSHRAAQSFSSSGELSALCDQSKSASKSKSVTRSPKPEAQWHTERNIYYLLQHFAIYLLLLSVVVKW